MRKIVALFFLLAVIAACGHQSSSEAAARIATLNCILPGYDSLIYYEGSSSDMKDIRRGVVTDSGFINPLFRKLVARPGLKMVIKPGGGGDIGTNVQFMSDMAIDFGIFNRGMDTLDANEQKVFGYASPPIVKSVLLSDTSSGAPHLSLQLPRDPDGSDTGNALAGMPVKSQMVILAAGEDLLYAYMGGDINNGKRYTAEALGKELKAKKRDPDFSVVIKPATTASYKTTVDVLDLMQISGTKRFALVDISGKEEKFMAASFGASPQ